MGILVKQGTYEKGVTTQDNSLTANLNKYPEIERRLVELYPQYQVYYLIEKLGMFGNEEIKSDNSYEWKTRDRLDKPVIAGSGTNANARQGTSELYEAAGSYTVYNPLSPALSINDCFFFTAKDNSANGHYAWANPQDILMFQSGAQAIVFDIISQAAGFAPTVDATNIIPANEVGYVCKVISGTPTAADLAEDTVVAIIGDAFGEGSWGAYENKVYESTRRNWLSTTRRTFTITGDAMTNVSWINYKGERLWFYEQESITEANFKYSLEKKIRYAKRAMEVKSTGATNDPASSHLYPGGNGQNLLTWKSKDDGKNDEAPVIGDGIYAQISDKNLGTYTASAGLTESGLTEYIARLAQHSPKGPVGNEWIVFASSIGRLEFQRAMQRLTVGESGGQIAATGGSMQSYENGKDVKLGGTFESYHTMGNKFTLIQDMTMDDPHIHGEDNGLFSYTLSGSGDLIFMNMDRLMNGLPNLSLMAKQKRSYKKKYINGMMNAYTQDDTTGEAANGFDGFKCEWLAHNGSVLRNDLTCGKYVAV